jgi:hypothetical protein
MSTTLILLLGPSLMFVLIGLIVRRMVRKLATEPTSGLQSLGSEAESVRAEEPAAGRTSVHKTAAA